MRQKTPTGEEDVQRMIDENYKVELGFNADGWFRVRMPILIPKKDGYSVKYLEKRLEPVLQKFWEGRPRLKYPYFDTVIVFRHVYAVKRPGWERCVPADGEVDCVIRLVFHHVLRQFYPIEFRHYHCCALGEEECTEVYVMPASDLGKWLAQETSIMTIAPKGEKLYETIADAQKTQNDRMGKV